MTNPNLTARVSPETLSAHDGGDAIVALDIDAEAAIPQSTHSRCVALCLDASGSMGRTQRNQRNPENLTEILQDNEGNITDLFGGSNSDVLSRLDYAKAGACQIIDELDPNDAITVTAFGRSADTVVDPTDLASAEVRPIKDAIANIDTRGTTDILDGLETAWEGLQTLNEPGQTTQTIVLLSDGKDNKNKESDFDEQLPEIRADGISVMTAGIGNYDDELMAKIADQTDGISRHLTNPAEIEAFIEDTVEEAGMVVLSIPELHVRPGDGFELLEAGVRVFSPWKNVDDKSRDIEQAGDINRVQLPDVSTSTSLRVLLRLEGAPQPPETTAVVANINLLAGGNTYGPQTVTINYTAEETCLVRKKVENDWRRNQVRSQLKAGDVEEAEAEIEDVEDEELAIELREQTDLERTEL